MLKRLRYLPMILFMLLAGLALAACQPAKPAPTLVPTVSIAIPVVQDQGAAAVETPAAETPAGYLAPEDSGADAPATPSYAYPPADTGGGPAGMPARENRSQVTAKLLERTADPANPAMVKLHVQLLSSQAVDGKADFTANRVNTPVDLFVEAAGLPDLKAGDTFEAQVAYLGDENGGRFSASAVKIIKP